MALTITQQPSNVSFSDNPILVKARTDLLGKTFLRIVALVEVTAERFGSSYEYTEGYTYSVAGSSGEAVLNIAETISTSIKRYSEQYIDDDRGVPVIGLCRAKYKVTLREEYLDQMETVKGDPVTIGPFTAVMGGLSQLEWAFLPDKDAEKYIGKGMVLTSKPDGEVIYGGHSVYVPFVTSEDATAKLGVKKLDVHGGEAMSGGVRATHAYIPTSVMTETDLLPDGAYDFSVTPGTYTTRKYICSLPDEEHVSFLFINRFGIMESITAKTGKSLTYQLNQNHYIVSVGVAYVPGTVNVDSSARAEIKVSSGFVSQEWADWWVHEFLCARNVWMKLGQIYLPVSIVAENTVEINEPLRPSLAEVKFTIRCALEGSIYHLLKVK